MIKFKLIFEFLAKLRALEREMIFFCLPANNGRIIDNKTLSIEEGAKCNEAAIGERDLQRSDEKKLFYLLITTNPFLMAKVTKLTESCNPNLRRIFVWCVLTVLTLMFSRTAIS